MPTPCYVRILGVTQGLITENANTADSVADKYIEDHKDELLAQRISHSISIPTNRQSGSPSGRRVHNSYAITCCLNSAIPLLYNALTTGEKLSSVVISWMRTSIEGKQENFFTTKLENAVVAHISLDLPHCQEEKDKDFEQLVTVFFNYRKITWEHLNSGTSGADDWRNPNEA